MKSVSCTLNVYFHINPFMHFYTLYSRNMRSTNVLHVNGLKTMFYLKLTFIQNVCEEGIAKYSVKKLSCHKKIKTVILWNVVYYKLSFN